MAQARLEGDRETGQRKFAVNDKNFYAGYTMDNLMHDTRARCEYVRVRAEMRACVPACLLACLLACVRACVCACACEGMEARMLGAACMTCDMGSRHASASSRSSKLEPRVVRPQPN